MPRKRRTKVKPKRSFGDLFRGDSHILALWLIVLLAVVMINVFYSGPYLKFDDASYLQLAGQIGTHTFNPASSPRAYSWLFIYLSYLGMTVLGGAQSSAVAIVAIEYLSLVLLTYVLAVKVTGDKKLALLAALMTCIFPFTVQYSTRLLPDMLMGVLATLSVVFLLSKNRIDWILAGIMAGLLIYAKLMGLAFLIPFGICALATQRRNYVVPALLAVILIYPIPFIVYVHNPLFSFQNYGAFQEQISPTSPTNNLVGLMLMGSLFQEYKPISINFQNYQLGLLLWLAALGTILSIKYMDKKVFAMAGIFWMYLIYLCFGPITFSGYVVGSFITRYLIIVAAPMAILVAYAIKNMVVKFPIAGKHGWVHVALFLLIILAVVASLWHTYHLVYLYNELIRFNPYWAPPMS
jgi:4-amino-4-deoxy-L-arabinose transferase-like glycosyltransferase